MNLDNIKLKEEDFDEPNNFPFILNFWKQNGYIHLPHFISQQECNQLIAQAKRLTDQYNENQIKSIFSTKNGDNKRDLYFLNSGNKIRYFIEEENSPQSSKPILNKIGHALHALDPVFKNFSHQPKFTKILSSIGQNNPQIVQSMYIFKHPQIGGEVRCHQDQTYLYTSSDSIVGMWFALEDATKENGCLWAIPGEHKKPLRERYIREGDKAHLVQSYDYIWPLHKAIALEAKKGDLILLHGKLPHFSHANSSHVSRQAYTLHIMNKDSHFDAKNWCRPIFSDL